MNLRVFCFLLMALFVALLHTQLLFADEIKTNRQEIAGEEGNTLLQILVATSDLKGKLQKQIEEKKKELKKASGRESKAVIEKEIDELQLVYQKAEIDFERIATGVDISRFKTTIEKKFNLQEELFNLIRPAIAELKDFTADAQRKTVLIDQQKKYTKLLPLTQEANAQLQYLHNQAKKNKHLDQQITALVRKWQEQENRLKNSLEVNQMELAKMDEDVTSFASSSQNHIKNFFRTRGLYIVISIAVCIAVVLLLKLLHTALRKMVPGSRRTFRPFHVRVFDLAFQIATVFASFASFLIVFYLAEDWVLLSLTVLALTGLFWTAKTALPKFWNQCQLMLNIGSVREGERINFYGVPWVVKNINIRTTLFNPDLDESLIVPINDIMDKASRPFSRHEMWFPCRKNDWVILADNTRGKIVHQTHELVEMVIGGSHKIYRTNDFLGLAPLNISQNFLLNETFGVGYCHQAEATTVIPKTVQKYLLKKIREEGHESALLDLQVEFSSAGASSLDFVVLASFKGSRALFYSKLRRAIQRWCVEVCTENCWDIPFPQMTIHQIASEQTNSEDINTATDT